MLLKGKNAVITGSNRGIGRAIVEVFAQNGATIWACARKYHEAFEADMKGLEQKYGVAIHPVYFELTDSSQVKDGVKKIKAFGLPIDVLVNNAGVNSPYRRFQMIPMEGFRQVFEANFFGGMELTQLISRLMMKNKKGSIVHIASIAATDGFFASCDYVASKAAILGAATQQARELGGSGIRVNVVSPGVTDTEMLFHENEEMLQSILPGVMLGRFGDPEEIANAVLFLASDLSSYITGEEIRVDGGCRPPKTTW